MERFDCLTPDCPHCRRQARRPTLVSHHYRVPLEPVPLRADDHNNAVVLLVIAFGLGAIIAAILITLAAGLETLCLR